MAKIYFNKSLSFKQNELWYATNGATRNILILEHQLQSAPVGEVSEIRAKIALHHSGKTYRVILLDEDIKDERILGIFLNKYCGYDIVEGTGEEIWSMTSTGGAGNSQSKIGIYTPGTILQVYSYKHRQGEDYYELTEQGWIYLGKDVPLSKDALKIL
jgi:hypothetical protein